MKSDNSVKDSLELLTKRWKIDPEVYDLHLGKRNDVVDTIVEVNRVIFQVTLQNPYSETFISFASALNPIFAWVPSQ